MQTRVEQAEAQLSRLSKEQQTVLREVITYSQSEIAKLPQTLQENIHRLKSKLKPSKRSKAREKTKNELTPFLTTLKQLCEHRDGLLLRINLFWFLKEDFRSGHERPLVEELKKLDQPPPSPSTSKDPSFAMDGKLWQAVYDLAKARLDEHKDRELVLDNCSQHVWETVFPKRTEPFLQLDIDKEWVPHLGCSQWMQYQLMGIIAGAHQSLGTVQNNIDICLVAMGKKWGAEKSDQMIGDAISDRIYASGIPRRLDANYSDAVARTECMQRAVVVGDRDKKYSGYICVTCNQHEPLQLALMYLLVSFNYGSSRSDSACVKN